MPSISQKELDELRERNERQADEIGRLQIAKNLADFQLAAQSEILYKIARAAHGAPILLPRPQTGEQRTLAGGMDTRDWRFDPVHGHELPPPVVPTSQERAEIREAELHQRLEEAQSRLAAVVAIAEMGQEHRA